MKKTLIFRLLLMAIFSISLFSCINEEFTAENSNTSLSSKITSRDSYKKASPWKEDEIFITKTQEVFLKIANPKYVQSKYGELYWNYAMSFGQFGENYLLVPVVRENKVSLLMEVVRKEDKVYFYEKEDAELIDFFNSVLFSTIIDFKESFVSSERNTAKIAAYVCTKRTIIVGCPPGVPDCVPITKTQTVCERKEGGGVPPKTFDPIGLDGGGGGGGGGGYDYPDPPPTDPCERMKALTQDPKVQNAVKNLKEHLTSGAGGEKGWKFNKTGEPTQTTQNANHSVNFGDASKLNGAYHNHTGTGVDMFSATDISTLIEIARYQSIGNAGNGFMGFVAPNGIHYVMSFNGNHVNLPTVGSYSETDILSWDTQQVILMFALLKNPEFKGPGGVLNSKGLEQIFFKTLQRMGLSNKVMLQSIDSNNNISEVKLNSNGTTQPIPCP